MAKDTSSTSLLSPSLLLKLRQAYQSMPELDMTLFSVIKSIQENANCESISIWLLNETATELECTHAVGIDAAGILGNTLRAQRFVKAHHNAATKHVTAGPS